MALPSEIWLTDFGHKYPGEPSGQRPALIIGPSRVFDDRLPFVIVAPLTTTKRGLSLHVEVEPAVSNGLAETIYVQCELMRSVNRHRAIQRLGRLDVAAFESVMFVVHSLLANY